MNTLAITVKKNPELSRETFNTDTTRDSYKLKLVWGIQKIFLDHLKMLPDKTTFQWVDDPTTVCAIQVEISVNLDADVDVTGEKALFIGRKLIQISSVINLDELIPLLTTTSLSQDELAVFFGNPIVIVTVTIAPKGNEL